MCGRFNQDDRIKENGFLRQITEERKDRKKFNIGLGDDAIVLTANGADIMKFAYNKGGRYVFNARAEGFNNKTNEMDYHGKLGVHTNPVYKDSFRTGRCLIPVTGFIEGPEVERLSKPFKIELNYTSPFMLAAVYDLDEKYKTPGFSIITTWPNQIIKDVIGHHRCPAILDDPETWSAWLDPNSEIEDMLQLLQPPSSEDLEITPINPKYKSKSFDEPM